MRVLRWGASVINSRKFIAAILVVLLSRDLFLWWEDDGADLQGNANYFCDRQDFPAVSGPFDFVVTSHRTDCAVLAKDSTTYVYLHRQSEPDLPSNQVFRYDGNTLQAVWIDAAHVTIHVPHLSSIGKLVASLGGMHIAADYRYFSPTEPPPEPVPDVAR